MSVPALPIEPTAAPTAPSLADMLTLVEQATRGSEAGVVFGLTDSGDGETTIAMHVLVDHPGDELLGFRAPDDWHTFILVASGTDHSRSGRRVRLAHGTTRGGRSATLVRDLATDELTTIDRGAGGQLADVLCRVIGAPTPPPTVRIDDLVHLLWLDQLLAKVVADPSAHHGWREGAALHPAHPHSAHPHSAAQITPKALRKAARLFARDLSWAALRRGRIGGYFDVPDDLATWFDDGSYSRWVLRQLPPGDILLADLASVLTPTVMSRVRETSAAAVNRLRVEALLANPSAEGVR